MTTETLNERDLVIRYRDARQKKEAAEAALREASADCDQAEAELVELLTARNATTTAKYDGIGSVTLVKPRLYASFRKEDEANLFSYLEQEGRADLIKPTVNSQSLSGFIRERVEQGQVVPEFISYYLRVSARFNAA